jgi:glycerol kinase
VGKRHPPRELALIALVAGLVVWHIRRPQGHALEGAIFVGSLTIVWLGASLAH